MNTIQTAPVRPEVIESFRAIVEDVAKEMLDASEIRPTVEAAVLLAMVDPEKATRGIVELVGATILFMRDEILKHIDTNCGQLNRRQAYTWNCPTGETITWDVDGLKAACLECRLPQFENVVTLEFARMALAHNPFAKDIDDVYAMTRNLAEPLIMLPSPVPDPEAPQGAVSIIVVDGWHRLRKMDLTNHPCMKCYVVPTDVEKQCRVSECNVKEGVKV